MFHLIKILDCTQDHTEESGLGAGQVEEPGKSFQARLLHLLFPARAEAGVRPGQAVAHTGTRARATLCHCTCCSTWESGVGCLNLMIASVWQDSLFRGTKPIDMWSSLRAHVAWLGHPCCWLLSKGEEHTQMCMKIKKPYSSDPTEDLKYFAKGWKDE